MLGIIIAMKSEVNNLLTKLFSNNFIHTINGRKFYVVKTIAEDMAVISFSGIGKVNAAACASQMISNFKITDIINIGSAGSLNNDSNIFDVLIIDRAQYFDVDVTDFGYELNQVPKMPVFYRSDINLMNSFIKIMTSSNYEYKIGQCYTGDSFINKNNLNKFIFNYQKIPSVIDMECSAIAQVCSIYNIKYCSLKIISDKIFEPTNNSEQFNKNLNNISNIVDNITYNLIQEIVYKK